jgi:hypothetical protein
MVIKTALAAVGLLAMSNFPSSGQVRSWLPLPDTKGTLAADVLTFTDTSINFGSRATVRIYRPDGVYEIDNSQAAEEPKASETGSMEGTVGR